MSDTLSAAAPATLRAYYEILLAGIDAYGQGDALRPLLSEHLDFTGALAGHIPNAREGFLRGVAGFVATVQSVEFVREAHDERTSAVLYDARMPGGTVRFAEFFTLPEGVIESLHLHYDGPDYLTKGGR